MTDQFENIIGYENLYKINRQGEIWSCIYRKIMKQLPNDDGYMYVALSKEGTKHKGYIARLLALQYIPNPNNSPTVDHIDRNKTNNCLENLRWYTIKEQANNKSTNIALLTEEEKIQKKEDKKEYQANWARWNKLKTGETSLIPIPLKTEAEKKETRKKYTENLSLEQKEKIKEQSKKSKENHITTEEEKIVACARAKKQREDIKADPEKAAQAREYKKLKAAEYRADPAYVEKEKAQREADPIKAAEQREKIRLKMIEKRTDPAFVEKEKQQALARKNKSK
jgi:hypothetical protein